MTRNILLGRSDGSLYAFTVSHANNSTWLNQSSRLYSSCSMQARWTRGFWHGTRTETLLPAVAALIRNAAPQSWQSLKPQVYVALLPSGDIHILPCTEYRT